jgi:hypothetical protein
VAAARRPAVSTSRLRAGSCRRCIPKSSGCQGGSGSDVGRAATSAASAAPPPRTASSRSSPPPPLPLFPARSGTADRWGRAMGVPGSRPAGRRAGAGCQPSA